MPNEPKVAIIILNYNGFDDTVECLNSFKNINYKNYQIVLVDNGSDNNEAERLKNQFPSIHLIRNYNNRGFAGGNNDGISWSLENGFEYVVNLNNDCIVTKEWLTNLVLGLKSYKADFGASRIMLYPETKLICSYNEVFLPDCTAITINRYEEYRDDNEEIKNILFANGAGSIYSSRSLKEIEIKEKQFFDEIFFAYFEDIDLGLRLNAKQHKGVPIANAIIYHKYSRTSKEYSKFKIFLNEKNRILTEMLNYPIFLIFLGEIVFFLKTFTSGIYSLLNKKSRGYRYMANITIFNLLLSIFKARIWMLFNYTLISKNREERKSKGLINTKIYKNFYWNFFSILK